MFIVLVKQPQHTFRAIGIGAHGFRKYLFRIQDLVCKKMLPLAVDNMDCGPGRRPGKKQQVRMMLTIRNVNEIIERQIHALRIRKSLSLIHISTDCRRNQRVKRRWHHTLDSFCCWWGHQGKGKLINPSTYQLINLSTHQPINLSTYKLISFS